MFFHLDGNPAQFCYPPIAGDVDNVAAALRPSAKVELRVDSKDIENAKHTPKHYVTVIAVSLNHAPIRTYEDAVTAWNDDVWMTRWVLSPIVNIIVGLLVVAFWATTWIEWREKNGK